MELWQRHLEKTFGSTFTSCPARSRILGYLQQPKGLLEVKACLKANVPLHGVSQANCGIQACRDFYHELDKLKRGSKPLAEPGASLEEAPEADADPSADDAPSKLDMAMADATAEMDPEESAVVMMTSSFFDQIFLYDDEGSFDQSLKERVFPTWRVIFFVHVQTSRVSVSMKYLTLIAELVKTSKLERFVIEIPVGFLVAI